jgi:hypothetical protein
MPIPIARPPDGNLVAGNQTARFQWLVLAVEAIITNQEQTAAVVDANRAVLDKILKLQPGES